MKPTGKNDQTVANNAMIRRCDRKIRLSKEEYAWIIRTCISSKTVQNYLINERPQENLWLQDMILRAPITLYRKAEIFEFLAFRENLIADIVVFLKDKDAYAEDRFSASIGVALRHSFYHLHIWLQKAIDAFEEANDGLYNLVEKWYDQDYLGENHSSGAPFLSVGKAIDYIDYDLEESEINSDDYNDLCWYEIEKWENAGEGNLVHRYTYVLFRKEPIYFEEYKREKNPFYYPGLIHSNIADGYVNFPMPFTTGDIVLIDCTPFAPPKPALIIEPCSFDTVYPQILFKDQKGTWNIVSLKTYYYSDGYGQTRLNLSPCYRIDYYDRDLACDEQVILDVKEWLEGDPEKGACLWKTHFDHMTEISNNGEMTEENIHELLELAEGSWRNRDPDKKFLSQLCFPM